MKKPIISLAGFPRLTDIRRSVRQKVAEVIGAALEVELDEAVRGGRYERSPSRRGYRNGRIKRTLTTSEGPVSLEVPRARTVGANGETQEFQSTVLPRYARRTGEVNEAVLGAYFGGGNTRRIKRMLAPLLGEANLSKSAVSRLLAQVKELLASWSSRELSGEWYAVVYLDAIALKVRLARRAVTVPVLVALGASADGDRRVIAMRPATSESGASWEGFVSDLAARGLKAPRIVISDGHPGLKKAMEVWSKADVQRCAVHKLRNLLRACPRHAHAELKRDYDSIGYAEDGLSAREAYARMVTKWRVLCPSVAKSLEEAGLHLVTFYAYPKAMWKSLRSTNPIENLNREFRRRTKTQGSYATEAAAVSTLFGLMVPGHIALRKITGYEHMIEIEGVAERCESAA